MSSHSTEHAHYQFADVLGGIETLNASYYRQNFSRHSHEGYTVGVIETGAQRFYRTGGNHVAPQHSIILVNADEVHNGCSATDYGWSYRAIYPLPQQFAKINDELGRKAQGAPYFPEPVIHDKKLAQLLRQAFSALTNSGDRLLAESLIYCALINLMLRHSTDRQQPAEPRLVHRQLELVKQFLDEYPASDVSLEQLATLAGLSPGHLLRQFQHRFGLPPHAYQIQARLRQARQRIKQGLRLVDVAIDCGFHDQSHLHRHFKRAMGVTPGQYAKSIASSNTPNGYQRNRPHNVALSHGDH